MRDDAPDLAEPILGWRAWLVTREFNGWRLRSPYRGTAWPAGEALVARCRQPLALLRPRGRLERHSAPSEGCVCGIYAAREPEAALRHLEATLTSLPRWPAVLGLVALWGKVIESELGWRAERGYPLTLFSAPGWKPIDIERGAAALEQYDVPLKPIGGASWVRATAP
ncbi:MAG: hypothetical protein AB7V42_11260 [Thermoleophilia bacterium]